LIEPRRERVATDREQGGREAARSFSGWRATATLQLQ
jgi:hypothetical protein